MIKVTISTDTLSAKVMMISRDKIPEQQIVTTLPPKTEQHFVIHTLLDLLVKELPAA